MNLTQGQFTGCTTLEQPQDASMSSRTMESRAGGDTIPFHKHCQATILAACGYPAKTGLTWNTISGLTLNNMPSNWLNYFNSNTNVTDDLSGILQLLNYISGQMLKSFSFTIKINEDTHTFNASNPSSLNYTYGLGRDITLTLDTGNDTQTFKFNTIYPIEDENFNIDISSLLVNAGTGLTKESNTISLNVAKSNELGGIKVGSGLSIDANGMLSAEIQDIPIMSSTTAGIAKSGTGLEVSGSVLSVDNTIARLNSPTFTGTPKSPTPTDASDDKMIVNKEYLEQKLSTITSGVTLKDVYPVGSIYISISPTLPSAFTDGMTWEQLASGRCLWTAEDGQTLGNSINGILPNHTHALSGSTKYNGDDSGDGRTYYTKSSTDNLIPIGGTLPDSIQNVEMGDTLRPPSIAVNMWKRIS